MSRPGRSGGDELGFETIRGCVHKRRTLNTRLSSGTSEGTFAVSAGPYRNYRNEAGTKIEPDTYFVPLQKMGWKIDPHVSNLRSREFKGGPEPLEKEIHITFLFFPKEQVLLCLSCGRWRITQTMGPRARGILPSLRTLTNEAERTLDRRLSRQGKSPWLSTE